MSCVIFRIHAVESLAESAEMGTKLQILEPDIKCLLAEIKAELGSSGSCLEEVDLLLSKEAGSFGSLFMKDHQN